MIKMKIVSIFPIMAVVGIAIFLLNNLSNNIDISGDGEWNKKYENFAGEAYDLIKVKNGYVITGGSMEKNTSWSKADVFLLKIDKNGDIIWYKTYGGNKEDIGSSLLEADDGYIICGYTLSYGNGGADIWVIKTDKQGNKIWNKTYGGRSDDFGKNIIKTNDGFVIVGSSGNRDGDVWVLKIDKNGNEIWNKTYDNGDMEWATKIIKDGNEYIIVGDATNPPSGWLIRIDEQGNEIWNKTYGGGFGESFSDASKTDNGFILAGATASYDVGFTDGWLLKIDREGNEIWNKSFGRRFGDFFSRCLYDNGSYILAGGSYDVFLGNKKPRADPRIWIIKCADYFPPQIKIIKPSNYLYIFDRGIAPMRKTFILGYITVIAEVNDSVNNVNRVEFYLASEKIYDYKPRAVLYHPPYEWKWDSFSIGLKTPYTITAAAYYGNAGAVAVDNKIEIYIINPFPDSATFSLHK